MRFVSLLVCALSISLLGTAAACGVFDPVAGEKPKQLAVEGQCGCLAGFYTCENVEPSGKIYRGMASITRKDDVYNVQWMAGGAMFQGIGIRQGDSFAVSWLAPGPQGGIVHGVNLYRVEKGPRLVGRYAASSGPGVLATERLTFLKEIEPED